MTPLLWPSTLCLSCSPDAGVHSAGCWLSLLHLISIFSGPQLNRASSPFGLVWLSQPHLVYLPLQLSATQLGTWPPSWLRYIIIQRPHDRPHDSLLDLWNRMFNCNQAEKTVMQFTGHSLPVHQSMSVPWEFFSSSHFISQFPPTRFPLITAIRMSHLLLVLHLGMAFLAGSKGQNITFICNVCVWEGVGDRTELQYIDPTLMAISVVSFSFSRSAQPEAQGPSSLLDDSFLSCILSPTGLLNSIGGPEGPFGRVWLSRPHLVSNVADPQLSNILSWPSYIIVQRPLNRPLNLWNGMFNRNNCHAGHSLPVHQSMSVPWLFYLVPFC